MFIQILIDNKDSWIIKYSKILIRRITELGHKVELIHESQKVKKGDILFLLSCEKVFKRLNLNKHNIVVHESDLPKGRGFSPLTWQILEGKNKIPITLFEANPKIDSGDIYFQESINLFGNELIDEIRKHQFEKTLKLILNFIDKIKNLNPIPQTGKVSSYRRRTRLDSRLDINKSINEQFNLLRVVDNNRYAAFFKKDNIEYIIKIYKKKI